MDSDRSLGPAEIEMLAPAAWAVRDHARVLGKTRVGCAIMSNDGSVFVGCNVEHKFRSHDVHAEVNAISSMVAAGNQVLTVVLVVAERDHFIPCGACLDWIFEFGGPDCIVATQKDQNAGVEILTARDLMPHYPR